MSSLYLAVRLHWRLGLVVMLVTTSLLAGLALARSAVLEQTRRVAVRCVNTELAQSRQADDIGLYVAPDTTSRQAVAAHRRKPCQSGKPSPFFSVSRRIAVARPPLPAPAPTSGEGAVQAVGQAVGTPAPPPVEEPPPPPREPSEEPQPQPEEPPPPPLDTIAPETSITNGPPATTTSGTVSFAFASSEAGSTFQCRLDEGAWSACLTPKGYSGVAVGAHEFSVRATDSAGNVDPTPASQGWTREAVTTPDTTPPQTSIVSGPAATTTATSASFTISSNEAGSSFECKLDESEWASCSTRKTYADLDVGSHEFLARAIDPAENVDTSPAVRGWTIEEAVPAPPPAPCSSVVTSVAAAQSAISSASAGDVVCLADGSYGSVSISASKPAQVTLQAEHPGRATLAGASIAGSHLTLTRFDITNEVTIQPGASSIAIEYNSITGGYMGINAGPTTSTSISDTTIRGNRLVGPFGEDALRINRYHDSGDADPYGILIEANEITGVRENGNHSDCLQSVWGGDGLYFRRNYLHDNRCQGFFVKDQPSTVVGIAVEDNLFLRNSEPCAPEASGCGQPSYLQIFGPYQNLTMRRNTVWQGEVVASFQDGAGSGTAIEANVVNRFWTSTDLSGITYGENTRCKREATAGGSWPSSTPGETVDCAPAFNAPASDDFRLIGSDRGVDWAPAEQHYGP